MFLTKFCHDNFQVLDVLSVAGIFCFLCFFVFLVALAYEFMWSESNKRMKKY